MSVSTRGSEAGSELATTSTYATPIAPGLRATRTTATQQCVTSSSKWMNPTFTSTNRRRRSMTTPIRFHRPCHPQTLTLPWDPWPIRATAAHIATASPLLSPTSPTPSSQAPLRLPMVGRGEKRTGWSVLTVSTVVKPSTFLRTGEAGARMHPTLYEGASGGSAACGWQTPCSTTACLTQKGTTRTPAPVTGVRAAEADLAAAGSPCSACLWWRPASVFTRLSTLATEQGLLVAAVGGDTRP